MSYVQVFGRDHRIPFGPRSLPLTHDEWELVLEALGAYAHHREFRAVREKIMLQIGRS